MSYPFGRSSPLSPGQRIDRCLMGISKVIECSVALVTRQQHLTDECVKLISDCHLYIVSRRPRTYVDPETARIRRGVARGHVIVESQEGTYIRRFRSRIAPRNIEPLRWLYGPSLDYCSIVSKRSKRGYLSGDSWALAFHVTDFDPHLSTQEVIYVGRSLGKTDERIALDRVLDHKTLQKIYADHQSTEFDIFITFLRITDAHTLTRLGSPESFTAVDRAGIGALVAGVFRPSVERLREQVMLAEAALIAYFQPSYNHNLLKFPKRSSKLARNIDDRGYTNIEVALTDSATGVRFWSPSREPARYHRFRAHLPATTSAKAGDLAVAAHEIAEETQITSLRIAESVEQAPICHTFLPGKPPRERDSRLRPRSSRPGPLS